MFPIILIINDFKLPKKKGLFKGSSMTLDTLNPLHMIKNNKQNLLTETDAQSSTNKAMISSSLFNNESSSSSNLNKQNISSVLSPFDEQEEWAKISEIMASFGAGLLKDSTLVSDIENDIESRFTLNELPKTDITSIQSWLIENGLIYLELKLIENGYDEINFIVSFF